MKICRLALIFLFLVLFTGLAIGLSNTKYDWLGAPVVKEKVTSVSQPDWLNPFGAGRPEWDPYGPGGEVQYLGRPDWDPYSPGGYNILQFVVADPVQEGLAVEGALRNVNQLYVQRSGVLTTDGDVYLGQSYVLWAFIGSWGATWDGFTLYDFGNSLMSRGYLSPGWYRISGFFAEVMDSHSYSFVSRGLRSNSVNLTVMPGGYPLIYSLVGRVMDQYGIGMPGVQVRITSNEGGTFTRTTDNLGYYGMDVPSGYYIITAYRTGYSFTQSTGRVWTGTTSAAKPIFGYPIVS